jgi:hypothetical protein
MFFQNFHSKRPIVKNESLKKFAQTKIHARFMHDLVRFMSFLHRAFSSFLPVCSWLSTDHWSRSYARRSVRAFSASFPLLPHTLECSSSMAAGLSGRAPARSAQWTRSLAEIWCRRRSTCTRARSWRPSLQVSPHLHHAAIFDSLTAPTHEGLFNPAPKAATSLGPCLNAAVSTTATKCPLGAYLRFFVISLLVLASEMRTKNLL